MQIFVLESTVHAAARALCDRHVINQIGETAELLSIAHYLHEGKIPPLSRLKPRVLQHRRHPCSLWVAHSARTYEWAYRYAVALCIEYTVRFRREHAYEADILQWLRFPPFPIIDNNSWTPWPQVLPVEMQMPHDPVTAYRTYYQRKSTQMDMRWSRRPAPKWYVPSERMPNRAWRVMA